MACEWLPASVRAAEAAQRLLDAYGVPVAATGGVAGHVLLTPLDGGRFATLVPAEDAVPVVEILIAARSVTVRGQ